MSSLAETICEAMAKVLRGRGVDAAKVTNYYESRYRVSCDTCAYDKVEVTIIYETWDGRYDHYDYSGGFAELIDMLTNQEG